jgi:acyl carrier protein
MLNSGFNGGEIEQLIYQEIERLFEEREAPVPELTPDAKLHADLGLASLDLAALVAVLEEKLQVDPFEALVAITDMRTVGDLCRAYQAQLDGSADAAVAGDLLAAQQRACARRGRR